jgi:transmembrane sensor
MNESTASSAPLEAIEQQAAAWILRQDRGFTAAEQDDFLQWLATDPRHGAALARHRRNWERLNLLAQWRPEHSPRPNRDLLAPKPESEHLLIRFPRRWLAGLSLAAAAVAIGFFLYRPSPVENVVNPAAPVAVATIEQRTLEDGSRIELNRGAVVSVRYTATDRRVRLEQGEAHFTVAKNPDRPFIVTARGVDVRAVGTAFNVRLGDTAVEVLVTEGRVQVDEMPDAGLPGSGPDGAIPPSPAAPLLLIAGQSATVDLSPVTVPQIATVTTADMEQRLAWQPRLLDFSATPLQGIIDEFNRCNTPYRLMIADEELAAIRISASLRSDNVEGVIRLLEAGFGVRSERTGHDIVLHRR